MSTSPEAIAVISAIEGAEIISETIVQIVARLAKLPPLEYERIRKVEAERIGIDRVMILDNEVEKARKGDTKFENKSHIYPEVIPWANCVDGAELLDEIYETLKKFIVCSEETAVAATLWISFTWFIDHAQVAPLAVITAPEKRCGKTQMLSLIGKLSRRPLVASNISPSAIFRVVERDAPTLLIDEADTFLRDNEEARGILNSGHTRSSAYTIRNVGEDHEPTMFCTWGAKALCGIGVLPDTLMDRAIILELRRKLPHEKAERLRHAKIAMFDRLASMLARYSMDNGLSIAAARPDLPDSLNDRAQDNWEPLLAIADQVGGRWPALARSVAVSMSEADQATSSLSTELLADIREAFGVKDRMTTRELLEELNSDDLKPWSTFHRGKPITPRQLAKRVSEYAVNPDTLSFCGVKAKGYKREWFDDAFERYLSDPSEISVVTLSSIKSPSVETVARVTDENVVTVAHSVSVTAKVLQSVQGNVSTDGFVGIDRDAVQERAAIMEFDAPDNYPSREAAASAAYVDVLKNNQNLSYSESE